MATDLEGADLIAGAVDHAFTSDQYNCNAEGGANIVDALFAIARALRDLGNSDAATPMGGLEALGLAIKEGCEDVGNAIRSLSDSVDRMTQQIDDTSAEFNDRPIGSG